MKASECFDEVLKGVATAERTLESFNRFKALPYEAKLIWTRVKIKQFYHATGGKICVAFSGGKDSTVLLHMVREIYPDTPGVFFDTGLEYPEIREHVKKFENIHWVRPKKTFKKVIAEYGFPVVSKEVSKHIEGARRGNKFHMDKLEEGKWLFMLDAPFKISDRCCYHLKKAPAKRIQKELGLYPLIGMRGEESRLREMTWVNVGENNISGEEKRSNPMLLWTDEDVDTYIEDNNIELAALYYNGYKRTGCMFCMFGVQHESVPNRFQKMRVSHPKLWSYCMRPPEEGGLGLQPVLDYMGILSGAEMVIPQEYLEEQE